MAGKYESPAQPDDLDALMREAKLFLDQNPEPPEEEPDLLIPEEKQGFHNYANGYGDSESTGGGVPVYNPDFDAARKKRIQTKKKKPAPQRPAPVTYEEDWDDEEEEDAPVPPKPPKKKKKKKHHPIRNLLLLLLLAVAGLGIWILVTMEMPKTDKPLTTRKEKACTVLLCGTDKEGTRTDTMMLLYMNPEEKVMNLVSLPRDTLTRTVAGNYAKLNSAFGRNNGREDPVEGMDNLMLYVADIIGYMPDGYMLVDLDCFVDVVDLMGGVEFDVPQDMYYADPSQDLLIDLKAGHQRLNGVDAMGLVRFRKGYATQDLGRVEVQREFLSACLDQWLTPKNLLRLPKLLNVVMDSSTTSLTRENLTWLGWNAWRCGVGSLQTATLPGYADMVGGASVYVLEDQGVAELVNRYCNPYMKTITTEDLTIAH